MEEIGRKSGGDMAQLNIGPFRLYIATHPDHVQHVFRDNSANYLREGMMWRPMRRLIGSGLAGEGPVWESRRSLFRPMFSARSVTRLTDAMVEAITQALDDDLDPYAASGRALDVQDEMTRIVHRVFRRIFLGDGISMAQTRMLGTAVDDHLAGLGARMLLPFVPHWVPMPGDRAYRRADRTVDSILLPLIRDCRARAAEDRDDVVSVLCRAGELDDRQIRDDVIASFAAATESTALSLTWLWVLLESHPEVAARLTTEVVAVVGAGPLERAHLSRLVYTKRVLQELIRLYPAGWIIPRTAAGPDTVGGVTVKGGSTVLISPYLMHRLEDFWERPHDFDPDRFDPDRFDQHRTGPDGGDPSGTGPERGDPERSALERQRGQGFSYMPFGAGPHTCLGSHLFTAEAQLIIAALLSRYRPRLSASGPVRPRPRATLHPDRKLEMFLERADG